MLTKCLQFAYHLLTTTMASASASASASGVPVAKEVDWSKSKGRRLLYRELKKGNIPADMHWKEVFRLHPQFAVGPSYEEAERLFYSRLSSARKTLGKRDERAAEELSMMQADRLLHPAPAFDVNGFPRWQGSPAQEKLLEDVREKKHETMSSKAFFESRPKYSGYTQQYISRKVKQAVKTNKFLTQYRKKKGHSTTDNTTDSTAWEDDMDD